MSRGPNSGRQILLSDVPKSIVRRFIDRAAAHDPDECWSLHPRAKMDRYSFVNTDGFKEMTHRVAVAIKDGALAKGASAIHSCDTPGCNNPNHLSAATHADNMADRSAKGSSGIVDRVALSRLTKERHAAGDFSYDHLRRGVHPKGKIVEAPDGRRWSSANAAAEDVGITRQAVAHRCRMGVLGWRYI